MVARLKTLGNDLVPKAASPVAQQRFYPNLSSSRHYEQPTFLKFRSIISMVV